MSKWGYKISKDYSILMDQNDFSLANKIAEQEPSLRICMGCGSCAGSCSASNFTDFSFRKMILLLRRGETSTLHKEIRKCMFCGKCALVCPRNVNTRRILSLIRESLKN